MMLDDVQLVIRGSVVGTAVPTLLKSQREYRDLKIHKGNQNALTIS